MNPGTSRPMRVAPTAEWYGAPAILYAEHNMLLARMVADVLELAGWNVYHFSEPYGAQAMLESDRRVDVMLLDCELRFVSGLELTRRARRLAHRRETPIILYSIEECPAEARAAGATEFLRKPANIHLIVDVVRRLLAAREPTRPA